MTSPNQTRERIGNYELIEPLGRGGMGIVYKARHVGLDRTVALKMILDARFVSSERRARFYAEARAAAHLNHRGIVSVHELGEHEGQPYYVMDYVPGRTLVRLLESGPLAPAEAAQIVLRVTEAVDYAHASGILHRDLKPSNIVLDADGWPRITDFGLAKRTQENLQLTQVGQPLGTPGYMSPEQALGKHDLVSVSSDVYGLGGVLYALLTGSPPIRADGINDVQRSVMEDLPRRPRELNRAVDRDLEAICLKCLEKRCEDRYTSATALASDLRRYLHGDSITARPPSYRRLFLHWARRPQRAPQAAVIVLILAAFYGLCGAVGLFVLLFVRSVVTDWQEAAMVVGLDMTGFTICLPIGLGMLAGRRRWMWTGLLTGCGMTAVVFGFIGIGFEAGGLLSDPFERLAIYSIFGFIGVVMAGACAVALVSQEDPLSAGLAPDNRQPAPESTEESQNLLTTEDR